MNIQIHLLKLQAFAGNSVAYGNSVIYTMFAFHVIGRLAFLIGTVQAENHRRAFAPCINVIVHQHIT